MPSKARCPHCGGEINPAALLAHMGKGGQKNFSAAERKRRAVRLAEARKLRHAKSPNEVLAGNVDMLAEDFGDLSEEWQSAAISADEWRNGETEERPSVALRRLCSRTAKGKT